MDALPTPFVPAEVDLRHFASMSIDVVRLRDSRFAATVSGEAFRCGLLLWCAAWYQMPAGTLRDLKAAVEIARARPGMWARLADFDADPMLLGVRNGVVDLRTGELRKASPDLLVSKRCRVEFDPAADCPRFEAFLAQIQPDPEVRAFVLRFMGYCLTGSVEEQAFLFLHGGGFNGKSVLVAALG